MFGMAGRTKNLEIAYVVVVSISIAMVDLQYLRVSVVVADGATWRIVAKGDLSVTTIAAAVVRRLDVGDASDPLSEVFVLATTKMQPVFRCGDPARWFIERLVAVRADDIRDFLPLALRGMVTRRATACAELGVAAINLPDRGVERDRTESTKTLHADLLMGSSGSRMERGRNADLFHHGALVQLGKRHAGSVQSRVRVAQAPLMAGHVPRIWRASLQNLPGRFDSDARCS